MVMGIDIVTCLYVNPELDCSWVIDYRIYNPIADGKDKMDHVEDMLLHSVERKKLAFGVVLFDSWYATHDLMKAVDDLGKRFTVRSRLTATFLMAYVGQNPQSWHGMIQK